MFQVQLQAIPNQTLSVQISNNNYDLSIRSISNTSDIMMFDISINSVLIIQGQRAVAGYPIIPYQYLENGNFVILTANDDLPNYTQFQITQYLIFADEAELEAIYSGTYSA
jgi:hypothetical protein